MNKDSAAEARTASANPRRLRTAHPAVSDADLHVDLRRGSPFDARRRTHGLGRWFARECASLECRNSRTAPV